MDNSIENIYKSHMKKYGIPAVVDNKTSTTIFFKEIKENNADGIDYKYIFADKGLIKQGSIINVEGKNYLALEKEEDFYKVYEKCIVRKCREIKLVAQAKVVYGVVDNKVYDVEQTKIISVADNQIVIVLNDNNYIKLNDIIEFKKKAYKVIAVDDTIEGLLKLKCEYDATNTHFYSIILNATSTTIRQNETYQISATVKDGEAIIENPTLIYTSNNNIICSVDETGLVTAGEVGNTTITVKFENVEVTLNVEVLEAEVQKTMIITGDYKLYLSKTREYTVTYEDGTLVADKTFTFSFDRSDLATISSSTSNSVTLKANSSLKGYCDLVCTCVEDSSIILIKNIWVRSLI